MKVMTRHGLCSIWVEPDDSGFDGYMVLFEDQGGSSTLARERRKTGADKRARHFCRELRAGRLLRPDASVYTH